MEKGRSSSFGHSANFSQSIMKLFPQVPNILAMPKSMLLTVRLLAQRAVFRSDITTKLTHTFIGDMFASSPCRNKTLSNIVLLWNTQWHANMVIAPKCETRPIIKFLTRMFIPRDLKNHFEMRHGIIKPIKPNSGGTMCESTFITTNPSKVMKWLLKSNCGTNLAPTMYKSYSCNKTITTVRKMTTKTSPKCKSTKNSPKLRINSCPHRCSTLRGHLLHI